MTVPNHAAFTEIKQDFENIVKETEKISFCTDKYHMAVTKTDMQKIEKNVGDISKTITEKAKDIKVKLDTLKTKIVPIEKMLYEHNMHKFTQIMDAYFLETGKFGKTIQDRSYRFLKIADPTLTDEQINSAIQENRFQDILISQKLDDAVKEIEEWHVQVAKLERSIEENKQLFIDFALIIDVQQKQLDIIEHRVSVAKDSTEIAGKSLNKAEYYQKKPRKCMCLIIIAVMAILAVVIFPSVTLTKI